MKMPKTPPKFKDVHSIFSDKNSKNILDYLSDNKISEFINSINKRYLHWDEFVYRTPPKNADKKLLWTLIKFNRNSTSKKIKICSKEGFSFSLNIPENVEEKLHKFDMNLGGNIQTPQHISPEDKERYLISSIMEEAIASSQLEGAATTRKVAKEMLKSVRKPRNKSEKMILNNYLTAKMIKETKVKKLTPDFILEIHKTIVKDTMDEKFIGKYRDNDEVIVADSNSEIVYYPPKYKLIPELIQGVCDFANDQENSFIHPIIKASILHFLIGYIHPFEDGNGRTARTLFYWYLSKNGYWLIEFMSISRVIIESPAKYAMAYLYTETDENDLTYFINYQIRTMDIALNELRRYISRKMNEKKEIFEIIKNLDGINSRQIYIIKDFYEDKRKTLTIKEVMETFDIVYQTARQDLLELENRGLLKKKILGKKKFLFIRSENFEKRIKKE